MKVKELKTELVRLDALRHAINNIQFDMSTRAPKASFEQIGDTLENLTALYLDGRTNKAFLNLVDAAGEEATTFDDKALIRVLRREINQLTIMPRSEYLEKVQLNVISEKKWEEARMNNDFSIFAPYLEKQVDYARKYARKKGYSGHPYDALLDDYEEGMSIVEYDAFFSNLRNTLVPFIQEITSNKQMKKIKKQKINEGFFQKDKQEIFMKFIAKQIGYDFQRGVLAESTHPFSSEMNRDDARITTKYLLNDVTSSIFSVLHEVGHARYQNNIAEKYDRTPLATNISMGMHESQSRFFENVIGRSKAFWEMNYKTLQALFPEQYEKVSLENFIQSVNTVEPSLIRTEADEVTYPLHIMVRYEIEKELIAGELKVTNLPKRWNDLMETYLGVLPKNDVEGVLQDIHWTDGSFGYFPTYALGSAYSAQFLHAMNQSFDVFETIAKEGVTKVEQYLSDNIHQYGAAKTPKEVLLDVTGEPFDSQYYLDYLTSKYRSLFSK